MTRSTYASLYTFVLTLGIAATLVLGGCATPRSAMTAPGSIPNVEAGAIQRQMALDPALERRILALDPERISEHDVRTTLALGPTPRIVLLHGGVPGTDLIMMNFGKFLIGMGYPSAKIRDPSDGAYSQSPYGSSERIAGEIAWYYEHDGVRPLLIGHSQGGIQAVKVLYELDGAFTKEIPVWNPASDAAENRFTIVDPLTGEKRSGGWRVRRLCVSGRSRRYRALVALPLEHGAAVARHSQYCRRFHRLQHRFRSCRVDRAGAPHRTTTMARRKYATCRCRRATTTCSCR